MTLLRRTFAALFIQLVFLGCTATEQTVDRFGESYRSFFTSQVIHPEGPQDPSPADTLPGELGSEIYKKRYIKTMTEKEKKGSENVSRGLRDLQ